jgi:hypothetical protein
MQSTRNSNGLCISYELAKKKKKSGPKSDPTAFVFLLPSCPGAILPIARKIKRVCPAHQLPIALFAWLISHQPAVLFSHNKSATSNQPAVLFSQNKPAPAISHQPTE